MAGIIGSMLKRRADNAAARAEHEKAHPVLPHHTSTRSIDPFPPYPQKRLKTYTTSMTKTRPRNGLRSGATVGDSCVGINISGSGNWEQDMRGIDEGTEADDELEVEPQEGQRSDEKRDSNVDITAGISYATLYIGLVLISLGIVILYAGVRDRGKNVKSVVLQLAGSIVILIGVLSAIFPLIQNLFPDLFKFIPKTEVKKSMSTLSTVSTISTMVPSSSGTMDNNCQNRPSKMTSSSSVHEGCGPPPPSSLTLNNPQHDDHRHHHHHKGPPRVTLHSFNEMTDNQPGSTRSRYNCHMAEEDDFDPDGVTHYPNGQQNPPPPSYESLEHAHWNQNEIVLTPKSFTHAL